MAKGKTGSMSSKNTPPSVVKKPTGKTGGMKPPATKIPVKKKGGSTKGKMC